MHIVATRRPLIALDLVDVVEDSWPRKRAWVLQRFGSDVGTTPRSRTTLEAFLAYRHGVVGHSAYEAMSAEIATPRGILARPPVAGVVAALHALRPHVELVVVSGRREEKRAVTERWLRRNGLPWLAGSRLQLFGYRTTNERHSSVESPKLHWCLQEGVDAYVDNQSRQLAWSAPPDATCLTRVLFSTDPAEIRRIHGPIHLARNWPACVQILERVGLLPRGTASDRGVSPHARGAMPLLPA